MRRTTRHRVAALALGVATGGALWWLETNPGIAAAAAVTALVFALAVSRLVREHAEFTNANRSWRDNRWSVAGRVFVVVVAFQAVYAAPVGFADRVGLLVVVLGTYLVGYVLGGLDALERDTTDRGRSTPAEPADD